MTSYLVGAIERGTRDPRITVGRPEFGAAGVSVGRPEMGGPSVEVGTPEMESSQLAELYKMARGADLRGAVQAPRNASLLASAVPPTAAARGGDSSYATNAPKGLPWNMPAAPEQVARAPRPAKAQDRWANASFLDGLWERFLAKADTVEGTGALRPGDHMVSFGRLPKSARDLVPKEAGNILGWDPRRLDADELELLNRLMGAQEPAQPAPADPAVAMAEVPE